MSAIDLPHLLNDLGMICVPCLARILIGSNPPICLLGETLSGGAEIAIDPRPEEEGWASLTTPPVAASVRTLLALYAMKAPSLPLPGSNQDLGDGKTTSSAFHHRLGFCEDTVDRIERRLDGAHVALATASLDA